MSRYARGTAYPQRVAHKLAGATPLRVEVYQHWHITRAHHVLEAAELLSLHSLHCQRRRPTHRAVPPGNDRRQYHVSANLKDVHHIDTGRASHCTPDHTSAQQGPKESVWLSSARKEKVLHTSLASGS